MKSNIFKNHNINKSNIHFVNAHINNISFPKTIEGLERFIYEHGRYNVEDIIQESIDGYTEWTVPRYSAIGDIVLFFHAKTAIQWIRKLETALKSLDDNKHNIPLLKGWLNRARYLYSLYGGKIFAIGRICNPPQKEDDYIDMSDTLHWKSRIFAGISDLVLLENPIDIAEFKSFILISRQSGITPLPSTEFQKLKEIIVSKNKNLPDYYINSKIGSYNLSKVNINNFLESTLNFRTRFLLEADFRSYYVDYFLRTIAGNKFYRECRCYTPSNPLARVDNIFMHNGKYILLEVKLNINIEHNLQQQLDQYITADFINLDNNFSDNITDFERQYMYVIDMYTLYKYIPKSKELIVVSMLDDLKTVDMIKDLFTK
ncbi:MAG: hypothetical protein PUG90_00775 [Clostridia bacterium]|nr:hypothetical protein [Clostridia bacterium]MDY4083071.1 hypothetical protein [Eubacteriales bacterium]